MIVFLCDRLTVCDSVCYCVAMQIAIVVVHNYITFVTRAAGCRE